MNIVLFGATGNIGQRIAKEALQRGHSVKGVVRDPTAVQSPDPRVTLVQGDATNAASVAKVSAGADAIVSAISPRPNARGRAAPSLAAAANALVDGKPEAQEGADALAALRARKDGPDWTFLSPAAEIQAGKRTGKYRTTGDQFLGDASGHSLISFEDYAVALVDELENPKHPRQRFGVAY